MASWKRVISDVAFAKPTWNRLVKIYDDNGTILVAEYHENRGSVSWAGES